MSGMFNRGTLLAMMTIVGLLHSRTFAESNSRETPLVRAVQQSRKSVVNIHTEKKAAEDKEAEEFRCFPTAASPTAAFPTARTWRRRESNPGPSELPEPRLRV